MTLSQSRQRRRRVGEGLEADEADGAAVDEGLERHDAGVEDSFDGPIQENCLGARFDARLAVVVEHVRR